MVEAESLGQWSMRRVVQAPTAAEAWVTARRHLVVSVPQMPVARVRVRALTVAADSTVDLSAPVLMFEVGRHWVSVPEVAAPPPVVGVHLHGVD